MDPQVVSLLNLFRDALAAVAIIFGLSQCFSGYRLFDLVRQLPGALAGLLIAGGVAQLLWHDWPPTLFAGLVGAITGAWMTKTYQDAVEIGTGAAVGALIGAAIAATLYALRPQGLSPAALFSFVLVPAILGGWLIRQYRRHAIILATAFGGAGLVVGGIGYFALRATDQHADPQLFGAMLLGWVVLGVFGALVQHRPGSGACADAQSAPEVGRGGARAGGSGRPHAEPAPRTPNRRRAQALIGHSGAVSCIAWDPEERWLATGGADGEIFLWSAETGRPLHRLPTEGKAVNALAVSPDGRRLASIAQGDTVILVWSTADGRLDRRLVGHRSPVDKLAPDPNGGWLASAGGNQLVVWDWDGRECLHEIRRRHGFNDLTVVPGKEWLAFGDCWKVRLLSLDGRNVRRAFSFWPSLLRPGPFGGLWRGLLVMLVGFFLVVRRLTSRPFCWADYRNDAPPDYIAASWNGRWLAWTDWDEISDRTFRFCAWDLDSPARPQPFMRTESTGRYSTNLRTAFHPEGRWLAVSTSRDIRLYAVPSGDLLGNYGVDWQGNEGTALKLAISPDGSWLAVGGRNGNVLLIDPNTASSPRGLSGLADMVWVLAASPSGRALAGGDRSGNVALWDRTGDHRFSWSRQEHSI